MFSRLLFDVCLFILFEFSLLLGFPLGFFWGWLLVVRVFFPAKTEHLWPCVEAGGKFKVFKD